MNCAQRIATNLFWIGGDDERLGKFEACHPAPAGMAYNTYLLLDKKTVLFDTIDRAVEERFLSTLDGLLADRQLDYIVINHLEPDHSATLGAVAKRHPEARLVCTAICKTLISQFFDENMASRALVVDDGDTLSCGAHTLAFARAPMVHWPEVMVTYLPEEKILFSADAFGTFGTHCGLLFDDEVDFEHQLLPEMRRYYANIIGKYGTQVAELLDKLASWEITQICPLHGPVLRKQVKRVLEVHRLWAACTPECAGVVIAHASIYGGTRDVAEALAFKLASLGVREISLFDLTQVDESYVLAEAFRASNIVLASVTYNACMFPAMEHLLGAFKAHNLSNRSFSFIQNGSWGPIAGELMRERAAALPNARIVGEMLTVKSRIKPAQEATLDELARAIAASVDQAKSALGRATQTECASATGARMDSRQSDSAHPADGGDGALTGEAAPPAQTPPPAHAASPFAGPEGRATAPDAGANSTDGTATGGGLAGSIRGKATQQTRVVEVWRCAYCGYLAEVPEGTDMSAFRCPICFKSGKGQFVLMRKKIVPVR